MGNKRLTSQTLFAESRKDGIFPGDIGNMERDKFYYKQDEFNNEASEFKPGWDLQEKTEIKDDRDEVGYGIMKKVNDEKKARRATLLAHALLGSNASDSMIVAQGKVFYHGMSNEDIIASLKNWKAADELEETETETETEETTPAAQETTTETTPETETEIKTEETVETPENNVEEIETTQETTAAAEDEQDLELNIPDAPDTSEAELQITQVEPDPELQAAFMDEPYDGPSVKEDEPKAAVTANKKTGISHLPQPKLTASATPTSEKEELAAIFAHLATPDVL